ncbi:hypothetical protein [Spirosoma liriopis]|nr:hypothetical protein [Spirosoma liriopis]
MTISSYSTLIVALHPSYFLILRKPESSRNKSRSALPKYVN